MLAGCARTDITPEKNVWMDGMIREHPSEGVHDPLHARALVLANDEDLSKAAVIVSVDVCGLFENDVNVVRDAITERLGIPRNNIMIAATHTHSGPATVGYFSPREVEYTDQLCEKLIELISSAAAALRPAAIGCGSGEETTISHYRRLLSDDGQVIMNWEPFPPERIVKPLGEVDPEVGVLKIVDASDPGTLICVLFNHAGHPNVLSGDNYLISSDYPGVAAEQLEREYNCVAVFVNGAQGTMDIDGLKHRDWAGRDLAGTSLARSTSDTVKEVQCSADVEMHVRSVTYTVPKRRITDQELAWASDILEKTGGTIETMADGVGDDYKAKLYREIHDVDNDATTIEQICLVIGNTAFITFPGEVFTEIAMHIKSKSPFAYTYFLGLVNGKAGYIPTRKAISEGGYAVDTRRLDDSTEDILTENSLALLGEMHACIEP